MVPPGFSSPVASAASTMRRAMRSFTDPPGFMYSTLASTVAAMPSVTTLSLTRGVFPTRSAMCSAYFTRPSSQTPDSAVGQGTCPGPGHRAAPPVVTVVYGRTRRSGRRTRPEGLVPWAGLDGRTRIAATAAYGGGGLAAGIGVLGAGRLRPAQGRGQMARRIVGRPFDGRPRRRRPLRRRAAASRSSWSSSATPSAAGMGADSRWQTVGAIIATGVSALSGRPVRLTNVAVDRRRVLGAGRPGRPTPSTRCRAPDVAVIMIGANDVTHRIDKSVAVRHLSPGGARRCATPAPRSSSAPAPTSGTIEPVAQPLRLLARRWSRDLAAAQTVAVVEAGGRTVSLGDLLGPEFDERPHEMFSSDRFHPSPAGYARAAAALLPSVCAALGLWVGEARGRARPPPRRGRRPVAVAAVQAVRDPGTEVSADRRSAARRAVRAGRWAMPAPRPHGPSPTAASWTGSRRRGAGASQAERRPAAGRARTGHGRTRPSPHALGPAPQ